MRTTDKTIQARFNRVMAGIGIRTTGERTMTDPGKWAPGEAYYKHPFLTCDYAACYGGWRLDVVMKSTGEDFATGQTRHKGGEMLAQLDGIEASGDGFAAAMEARFPGIRS